EGRGRLPGTDIGELTTTRWRSRAASRSALVGECAPPSTNATPPIVTGSKKLGIAHEAATASATGAGGAPGRPNTTRLPSRRRTAVSHRFRSGQSDPKGARTAAPTSPGGPTPAGSRAARTA